MPGEGLFGRLQSELEGRERAAGLSMADVLALPDQLRRLVNWMIRAEEVGLADVAARLAEPEESARAVLADLVERGFVRELTVRGEARYRVRLSPTRPRRVPLDIWRHLDERVEGPREAK